MRPARQRSTGRFVFCLGIPAKPCPAWCCVHRKHSPQKPTLRIFYPQITQICHFVAVAGSSPFPLRSNSQILLRHCINHSPQRSQGTQRKQRSGNPVHPVKKQQSPSPLLIPICVIGVICGQKQRSPSLCALFALCGEFLHPVQSVSAPSISARFPDGGGLHDRIAQLGKGYAGGGGGFG